MLTTFRQSFKTLVQTKEGSLPLGLLVDMVVNSKTGIFEAFWVKSFTGSKLLLPKDILFWNASEIIINSESDLAEPESFPRLKKVFASEYPILKATVFDQALGKNIGQVRDFSFDTLSPRLLFLEIRSGFLGLKRLRLPQHRIIKIEPHRIVVNSVLLKKGALKTKVNKKLVLPELEVPSQKEE